MSQHDYVINNQGFPAFRSDLNSALKAMAENQSGTSAPSTTYANMFWYDTQNNILKIRNEENDAFISLFTLDQASDNIESLTVNGVLTADSLVVDEMTLNADTITATDDFIIDAVGEIVLDADNQGSANGVQLKDGGVHYGSLFRSASDLIIKSIASDEDIVFMGNDGGAEITALTLDMSAGGNATFNGAVLLGSNLIVPNGNGIDFGANANASGMSSELLDDYEEGSFTPAPSSGAIASKVGKYIKIGSLVHVTMVLSNFSGASSSSVMQVGGIPFTNNGVQSVGSNYISNVNTGSSAGHVSTYVYPSNTIFRLYDQGDDVGVNALTYASFDTSSAVTVSFTYEIA